MRFLIEVQTPPAYWSEWTEKGTECTAQSVTIETYIRCIKKMVFGYISIVEHAQQVLFGLFFFYCIPIIILNVFKI